MRNNGGKYEEWDGAEWKRIEKEEYEALVKDIETEIERIKDLRLNNKEDRLEELGTDPDVDYYREREAEIAFLLEERYGFFKRFTRSAADPRMGDWISIRSGKTYDLFGMPDNFEVIKNNFELQKQRDKFYKNLDKHILQTDYVILDIEAIQKHIPEFYSEIMSYIGSKYGFDKIIIFK